MNLGRNHIALVVFSSILLMSCSSEEPKFQVQDPIVTEDSPLDLSFLPIRSGERPETTNSVPHLQIGVDVSPTVYDEMIRRVYSLPEVENRPSVVQDTYKGLWLGESITLSEPSAILSGREYGHIHEDGSTHIFLEPKRAEEAVNTGWAVHHPAALSGNENFKGFVMLYTPLSIEELAVTFHLIVDGYNYVTGEELISTDYYD